MSLNIYQKSVYAGLFNSTMIGRSVGKMFKQQHKSFKDFKLAVLKKSEDLINKLEKNNLSEEDIIDSFDDIVKCFGVSYGQAQKGINVILKYHYQLYKELRKYNNGAVLHCPLDSIILAELGENNLPLIKINKEKYQQIQKEIRKRSPNVPVDFDRLYEEKYLKKIGWYP